MIDVLDRLWKIKALWNEDHVMADDFATVVIPVMRMIQDRIPTIDGWYGEGRVPPGPPLDLTPRALAEKDRRWGVGHEALVRAYAGERNGPPPVGPGSWQALKFHSSILEGASSFDGVDLQMLGPETRPELWRGGGRIAEEVLRGMLELTPADRGLVTAMAHYDAQPPGRVGLPLGWLSYFEVDPAEIPPLPSPATVEPLGRGSLIRLGIPPSCEVPFAQYAALRAALEPTGILDPPLRRDERG